MGIEAAFLKGLSLVREDGLPAKANDLAVIAANRVFHKASTDKQHDPRFPEQGPLYAKKLILLAFAGK